MSGRRKILVVDDDASIREILATQLARLGYDVELAADGQEGLDAFTKAPPDLVLMDVMMPAMDGRAAYLAMRSHPRGQDIPVVLMSAAADPSRLDPGITAFLPKPFDLDQLLDLVARLLGDG